MTEENKKKVKEWLSVAGQILGINAQLSDEGVCAVQFGDLVVAIEVPDEGDWFCLYSPLGDLPKTSMEEAFFVCQRALELNAFQAASRGGALGLIPDEAVLVYSLMRPIKGCDEQVFAETIALFYEAALELREALELKPGFGS